MPEQMQAKREQYYLTHDEIVEVECHKSSTSPSRRPRTRRFRVRVWMAKGRHSVVLVTPRHVGADEPAALADKIATVVHRDLLRHRGDFAYFDHSSLAGLNRVYFATFGKSPERPMFARPTHEEVDPGNFRRAIGDWSFDDF